ncbi:MAG: cyclic nucleotide-binding domain-containing protein, partial [Nitrospinae bacterium]|nr:cyclic nucleotide-binding domain-containing protein [Nitrospinota bacterium]
MTNIQSLRKVDFLQSLPGDALENLGSHCTVHELEKETVLFQDGEEGSSMYIILSGELIVSKDGIEIARRYKGDYIGEMSLVGAKPRSATVKSTMPTVENLFELMSMIDAAKRASEKPVVAVIPYFGFARQDRKDKPRVAIGSKMVAMMLETAGADRVM